MNWQSDNNRIKVIYNGDISRVYTCVYRPVILWPWIRVLQSWPSPRLLLYHLVRPTTCCTAVTNFRKAEVCVLSAWGQKETGCFLSVVWCPNTGPQYVTFHVGNDRGRTSVTFFFLNFSLEQNTIQSQTQSLLLISDLTFCCYFSSIAFFPPPPPPPGRLKGFKWSVSVVSNVAGI